MKKFSRANSNGIVIFLVFLFIFNGYLYFALISKNPFPQNISREENPDVIQDKINLPKTSQTGVEFDNANRSIPVGMGFEENVFNDSFIKANDDTYDSIQFAYSNDLFFWGENTVNPKTVLQHSYRWGSTDGDLWDFTDAYKDDDGKYLYLETQRGHGFPGTISLKWGEYNDFVDFVAWNVYAIWINFEIWPDTSSIDGFDGSSDLKLRVYADDGSYQEKLIAASPVDEHHYVQLWNIQGGPVFDRVKAGGYIKYARVSMYVDEEIFTWCWINIDFLNIFYWYRRFNVIVDYELDYGSLGLESLDKFDLKIKMNETKPKTKFYLWDYNCGQWDYITNLESSNSTITIPILTDANNYTSGSKELKMRFENLNYLPLTDPLECELKIDMIKLELYPPETPTNLTAENAMENVALTWDPAVSNGPPIQYYNVYRGETPGGYKTLIATPTTNSYDDSAIDIGKRYYYVVSATNFAGTSGNSTENSGLGFDETFISWVSPNENEHVILPLIDEYATYTTFSFEYEWTELDDAILELDYGTFQKNYTVWQNTSIDIDFDDYYDGAVNATLYGFNQSKVVDTDVRHLTFVRIDLEAIENINSSTEVLGNQLYLILHDPNGDNSYSSISQSSRISIAVGCEITTETGMEIEIGDYGGLFGVEVGGSLVSRHEETSVEGFDFRYEIVETTTLTSSQVDDDPDYIGPGYGDTYWGEAWIFKWILNATYRHYTNGTERWEDPQLYYGIEIGLQTIVNHADAPPKWKSQNGIFNDSIPVSYILPFTESGGQPYEYNHEVTTTMTRSKSFEVDFGVEANTKIPGLRTQNTLQINTRNYAETEGENSHTVSYVINDDDPDDFLVMEIGVDHRFGTFIFNTSSFYCETSDPYEHNTYDYLPPVIEFPEIELDSDGDSFAPTPDDSPIVTTEIFEEDEIQQAVVWYSTNNGSSWQVAYLTELIGDPGRWRGNIPAQPRETKVLWYIEAWDLHGNDATRFNEVLEPYKYTVKSKPPPEPPNIPGFPTIMVVITCLTSFAVVVIKFNKKVSKNP